VIQVPPTPTQTFMQQVMPYLVLFIIGLLSALGLVIKAWATKLANQLQANHAVAVEAAKDANLAATAVVAHNASATEKLDNIEQKVNGTISTLTSTVNRQVADALADKDKQIADLRSRPPTL
jgi:hypothetical protein